MQVKEIMSPYVITVEEDETLKEAAQRMRDLDIGCLLVSSGGEVAGIITDRDITCKGVADGLDFESLVVSDVMSKGIIWCSEDQDIEDAIRLMENEQIRRLPVLDEERNLVGLISLGDVSLNLPYDLSGQVIKAVSMSVKKIYPAVILK